ncbi:MAG: ribosomal RNA small subunit methyltransferase A [bacterium]|nr:ribosomal RNA small subunit methyltransferase A [bacterium]
MHKLGQVFLKDRNIIKKIIETSGITKDHTALEIGCGEGWLSLNLAEKAKKLYIYEIDEKYFDISKQRLKDKDNTSFICGDILNTSFQEIDEPSFYIIANIPYYISTKIIKLIIKHRDRINSATIMVQKEFAKKLNALPGKSDYTSLTLYSNFHLNISCEFTVSKNCFRPVPRVDSAVIKITPKQSPPFNLNEDIFFSIIRSGFWARRKSLVNCLAKSPYIDLDLKFKEIDFFKKNQNIRGEVLSILDYYQLYKQIKPFITGLK